MSNNIKNAIDNRLNRLEWKGRVDAEERRTVVMPQRQVTPVLAMIVCLLVFMVPLLGATMPSFNRLLATVSPAVAEFLMPVESLLSDNGIQMEVIGAMRDENTVTLYLSIQDLDPTRESENIMLENAAIQGISAMQQEIVSYDKSTKTTLLKVMVTGDHLNEEELKLSVISVSLNGLGPKIFNTGIDLSSLDFSANTMRFPHGTDFGASYGNSSIYDEVMETGVLDILVPGEKHIEIPGVDNSYISNIGFVDGRLHIQLHSTDIDAENPTIAHLWLTDAPIDSINMGDMYLYEKYETVEDTSFHFAVMEDGAVESMVVALMGEDGNYVKIPGSKLEEYIKENDIDAATLKSVSYATDTESVYDVKEEELGKYRLLAIGFEDDTLKGNWTTTFTLDETIGIKKASCAISVAGLQITDVSLSPFQISFGGQGVVTRGGQLDVEVTMADGSVLKYGTVIRYISEGNLEFEVAVAGEDDVQPYKNTSASMDFGAGDSAEIRLFPAEPLDVEKIDGIKINGQAVELKS